jgi:branched-subunit amino acid transport protein
VSIWGSTEGWIAIAGLAIGTFLIRYSFIGFLAGRRLPPRVERALQLAVPAIFAALVIPLVIMLDGKLDWTARYPHAIAAVIAGAYAWWRGGMLMPLVVGMAVLHAILVLT